jgi:hypothetical protein
MLTTATRAAHLGCRRITCGTSGRPLRGGGRVGFSIPDRSRADPGDAGRDGGPLVMAAGPVGARALADQLGEPRAERPPRGTADREADLSHLKVTPPQQRLGPLDPARHQVAVRRLPDGRAEAAGEMARRHEGDARQRRNIQRLRVVAAHQVTGPRSRTRSSNVTRPSSHSARCRRCRRSGGLAAPTRRAPRTRPLDGCGPQDRSPAAASPPASMPEHETGRLGNCSAQSQPP